MAREIGRLDPLTVQRKTKRGLYADGGGLYLQISRSGAKSWIFRYSAAKFNADGTPKLDVDGKRVRGVRDMGLGPIITISLAEARKLAAEKRRIVLDGGDPIEQRRAALLEAETAAAKVLTFKECARGYIKAHAPSWNNLKHAKQWESTLERYAFPVFGDLPVNAVDTGMVVRVLEPIWNTKSETASRVRGRIEAILDWAKARGFREGENPARWKGHLSHTFPAKGRTAKVQHHPALPYEETGAFLAALDDQEGVAAKGLAFLILTAARTGEVIAARWDEMDLDGAVWTIPADRMKAGKEHRIPLSGPALAILHDMADRRVSEYVFPGGKANRPLSNMAFLTLLKRMGRADITAHGFRSTFRDWAAERTGYPAEVAEMALAHTVSNKVEAAYRRGDLFNKRRRLMGDWAAFCGTVEGAGAEVVALGAARDATA